MLQANATAPPLQCLAALAEAQARASEVEAKGENKQFHYKYATADSMLAEWKRATKGLGLVLLPLVHVFNPGPTPDDVGYLARTVVVQHVSGEAVTFSVQWPVVPQRDRRPLDKALASALTTSLAYLIRDALAVPKGFGDDIDSRTEQGPEVPAQPKPGQYGPKAHDEARKASWRSPSERNANPSARAKSKDPSLSIGEQLVAEGGDPFEGAAQATVTQPVDVSKWADAPNPKPAPLDENASTAAGAASSGAGAFPASGGSSPVGQAAPAVDSNKPLTKVTEQVSDSSSGGALIDGAPAGRSQIAAATSTLAGGGTDPVSPPAPGLTPSTDTPTTSPGEERASAASTSPGEAVSAGPGSVRERITKGRRKNSCRRASAGSASEAVSERGNLPAEEPVSPNDPVRSTLASLGEWDETRGVR